MTGSRWEKPVNLTLTLSSIAKNSSRSNLKVSVRAIGGARLSIWLISFSRVSTAKIGDHIIAGVAAEEPPELGGLLVPDGISATLIALLTMKTSHPTQVLSAPTLCSRGVVRVQKVVVLQWGSPAFPLAWKPTAVSSQVTVAESVTLRVQVFRSFSRKRTGACSAQAA